MIAFSNRLYVSESINEHKINRIKLGIRQGRGRLKLFLLTISNNDYDQLDIFHNSMLKQRMYRKLNLRIVGLAATYDEAVSLVLNMIDDAYKANADYDIKTYLENSFSG